MEAILPLRALASPATSRLLSRKRPSSSPFRCLHQSAPRAATPLPHPTAPGPPPEPPTPSAETAEDRVARKRKQAELLQRGQSMRANPAKPTSALQKRFWKDVSIKSTDDGYQIYLDSRAVRTQNKTILTIPHHKHQLATALALEWDTLVTAHQALKNHYIPLTSLTSRALDIQQADAEGNTAIRSSLVTMLMRYLSTDTILCWEPEKSRHDPTLNEGNGRSLRDAQIRMAQPIITHLTTHIWPGAEIQPVLDTESILPQSQPQMTQEIIRGWLTGLPSWEIAGLERAVLATKSLLVATRLLTEWSPEFADVRDASERERFGIEEAAEACSLEVRWQTGMWGEVEDTHDVEKEDLRRQLGSVILLVNSDHHGRKMANT